MSPLSPGKGPEEDRPAAVSGGSGPGPGAAAGAGLGPGEGAGGEGAGPGPATGAAVEGAAPEAAAPILCAVHGVPLEPGKVEFAYQGHNFPVDVLRCPVCGIMLVPEDLARGRMREVEQTLEEK